MLQLTYLRCSPCPRQRTLLSISIGLAVLMYLLIFHNGKSAFEDGRFYFFFMSTSKSTASGGGGGRTSMPKPRFFKQVVNRDIFLYSAIANSREPRDGELNIIISAFDSTGTDSLQCCVVMKGKTLFTTPATIFHKHYCKEGRLGPFMEMFKHTQTRGKQYACVVPELGFNVSHVTLTSSSCPVGEEDYLPVIFPKIVPQGLALCAKAAYGSSLDPNLLMEWFEVQRLLGVDHIQIMDMDNPEPIQKVFRYYKDMGLLNVVPYELPGPPYNRGLDPDHSHTHQLNHDEMFPIMDCKQRLRGYSYVLGHDLDEVLMPAKHVSIKDLVREQLMLRPDAAGFYFYSQYFIYDWGPTDKNTDINFFRYLNSTLPIVEREKYVYLMNRVVQARIHSFAPRSPFNHEKKRSYIPAEHAVLHHYRKCPVGAWKTCNPTKITNRSMLRFQGQLEQRLDKARQATGIRPTAS